MTTDSTGQHRLLGINIDHVATLRQARLTDYPCPVRAARQCIAAGADLITLHLREDTRHIQPEDLLRLLDGDFCRVNLEMSPTQEMVELACLHRPSDCCLVPEKRDELTTEGGLDVVKLLSRLRPQVAQLHEAGIEVSLFVEPEINQLDAAIEIGVGVVELHTGAYANASNVDDELKRLANACEYGRHHGLRVNAGHGLTFDNLVPVAAILGLAEFNIGHFVVSEALFVGFDQVIAKLKRILKQAFDNDAGTEAG